MIETLTNLKKNLGISGIVGALVGVALVIWIEPTTKAGTGLILVVSVLLSVVIGAVLSALLRKQGKTGTSNDN